MAQVKEVSKKGLQREFNITVPKDVVETNVMAQLEEIRKTAKHAGFRPGKMPMDLVRQLHGQSARADTLDKTISEAVDKTLTERNLRPAMQPKIELVSFAEDKDLEFTLAVEILPDVTPGDFSKISLERLTADVEDKIIEDAITRAAKSVNEPEVVTEKRAAKLGDVLVIDFDGTVDGKAQPGMKGEGHKLELGSKSFIDTFEDQLVGSKVGDKKTIKVTFPKEYHAENLAGKAAEFAVEVKELRAPKPVVIDEALAKELGFPSLEKLRERVKDDIGANYKNISRALIKRQLMDKLADTHDFEVPAGMLDAEFNSIWQQVSESKAKGELPKEDQGKTEDALKERISRHCRTPYSLGSVAGGSRPQRKHRRRTGGTAQRADGRSAPLPRTGKSGDRLLHANPRCDGTHARADFGRKSRRQHSDQDENHREKDFRRGIAEKTEEME